MSLVDDLKDIIAPEPQLDWDTNNGVVRLKEKNKSAKLKKVELSGIDNDSFIIKLDHYIQISPYFNKKCSHGLNKGCDGIILTTINGRRYLFICELKSSYQGKDLKQFRNSELFTDYLENILDRYYTNSLKGVKKVFVLFTKGRMAKRSIRSHKPRKMTIGNFTFFHVEGRKKINLGLIA